MANNFHLLTCQCSWCQMNNICSMSTLLKVVRACIGLSSKLQSTHILANRTGLARKVPNWNPNIDWKRGRVCALPLHVIIYIFYTFLSVWPFFSNFLTTLKRFMEGWQKCDQMDILFFQYLVFNSNCIIGPSRFKNLPSTKLTLQKLPKTYNFSPDLVTLVGCLTLFPCSAMHGSDKATRMASGYKSGLNLFYQFARRYKS